MPRGRWIAGGNWNRAAGRAAWHRSARRQRLHDPAQPFDLGIHLNLTQGRPLIGARYPAELLDATAVFPGIFGLFRRLRRSGRMSVAAAIEEELTCQVQFMLDRGHRPTHLNGHQYIEMLPVVGRVVESLLEKFRIPVVRVAWEPSWWQSFTWPGISTSQWLIGGLKKVYAGRFRQKMLGNKVFFADVFFGTMTAGTTSLETIRAFLAALHDFRLAEIGLHPAAKPDVVARPADGWHDPLAGLRPRNWSWLFPSSWKNCLRPAVAAWAGFARIPHELVRCVKQTLGEMVGCARNRTPENAYPCSRLVCVTHHNSRMSVLHPPYT